MSTRTPPDPDHAIHVTRDPRSRRRGGLHHHGRRQREAVIAAAPSLKA